MALVLRQGGLRWCGHVLWRDGDDWVKGCMECGVEGPGPRGGPGAVSYTHLTLPTIYSV